MIAERLARIEERIARAAAAAGRRPEDITLVAVSKFQPAEAMRELQDILSRRGRGALFGENYVQEFKRKLPQLSVPARCHFIGPLQRNKAKDAAALFEVIESVHDEKIAAALEEAARKLNKRLPVFVQVNISGDEAKSGAAPAQVAALCGFIIERCPSLALEGLMAITRYYEQPQDARPDFRALRQLRDELHAAGQSRLKLSMGMSQDFEVAIEEGADVIRIGTDLFGSREPEQDEHS